jgi:hypothetical protein
MVTCRYVYIGGNNNGINLGAFCNTPVLEALIASMLGGLAILFINLIFIVEERNIEHEKNIEELK